MHVTFLALGSVGDIQPYLTLGKRLQCEGYQVCIGTAENFAPLVADHGLDHWAIAGDAQAVVRKAGANIFALFRGFANLVRAYGAEIPTPITKTDLIINQLPLALGGFDLAEKLNIPMCVAGVIPLFPTRSFPLMGFPSLSWPAYNLFSYQVIQQFGWQTFRPMINRWRHQVLGLPPAPLGGYFHQLGTARFPILNGFSSHVVPCPPDWGEFVHNTGWWLPDERPWAPPEDLLQFLEAGPPPVFIGFGSMPVRNPKQTTDLILDALHQSGQRGIIHAGWGGLGERVLPENVYKIDYVPYSWLFKRMAMVIHHGGSGTLAHALQAGVPNLVVPFVFDQFFWGKRSESLGVGPAPIPFRRLSSERLASAILNTLSSPQMVQQAQHFGEKIRAENGVGTAVEIIKRFLK
jgi:UDP:flavonoid glycosyltransferase YjiC (YdhE family)